ncbi:MAG TPA: DUF664 domain-containing protein [Streptosporangiaceae bacterium]|jgi:uncharacterized damage-inducible protein DinB
MTVADLLTDAFDRIREEVHNAVDNLSKDELAFRVDPDANSIAWLVWHLTRVQDDHIADAAGTEQVWLARGWADRFGLPFGRLATGYEHGSEEVAAVAVDAELLTGYHDEVTEATTRYVRTLTDADLPRVVDESWDPPVTLAVRLVSVISDDLQHAGQAAFVRGILMRR